MSSTDRSWLLVRGCSTGGVMGVPRGCGREDTQRRVHHVLVKRCGRPIFVGCGGIPSCDSSVIRHVATMLVTQDIDPFMEQ